MALYIPHSIFHLARLLYVRPETLDPTRIMPTRNYQSDLIVSIIIILFLIHRRRNVQRRCQAKSSTWYRKVVALIIHKKIHPKQRVNIYQS